jgi:hypothetical protein
MTTDSAGSPVEPPGGDDAAWRARQRQWQRKLGRIRLGVEPIPVQLARYRRVTWMLTAIPFGIGAMFIALFAAFRRPDIGLIVAGVLLLPIIVLAWIDYGLLAARAARYLRECAAHEARPGTPGRT